MIWEGSSDELEDWFDKVFDRKGSNKQDARNPGMILDIDKSKIEG